FDNTLNNGGRFTGLLSLRAIDRTLFFFLSVRHLMTTNVAGIRSGDLHSNVFHQPLKLLRPGDQIGLTVHLNQHAALARSMNVGANLPLRRSTTRPLRRRRKSFLSQKCNGLFEVPTCLSQRFLAVDNASAGTFAQLFHKSDIRLRTHAAPPSS